MARLLVQHGFETPHVIDLKLGLNKFGRSQGTDFQLDHPTISSLHCEVMLHCEGVSVRDCGSTNGTFIDGERIKTGQLRPGQTLRMGDIVMLVESTDFTIAIPQIEYEHPAPPPVVFTDGSIVCPRHPGVEVSHQCTVCKEAMCEACVHHLRRRGGKVLMLCPICSKPCEPIGGPKERKRSIFDRLQQTLKLPFSGKGN